MTSKPQIQEDTQYEQGYWVEFQKGRLSGGVSAQARRVEGGLGAVYRDKKLGVTGYMQYSLLPFVQGRLQIDLLSDQRWVPQFTVGVPISLEDFRLEPHLLWSLEKEASRKPRLGLRAQYVF